MLLDLNEPAESLYSHSTIVSPGYDNPALFCHFLPWRILWAVVMTDTARISYPAGPGTHIHSPPAMRIEGVMLTETISRTFSTSAYQASKRSAPRNDARATT